MFPRVVQYGDGRDAATATAAPSEDASPAESDRVTRTHTGTSDSPAEHEPVLRRPAASPSTDDRLPAPLQYRDPARYEIVAEHGRGGLGRVFRARDKELGRDVALKELLSRGSTTELRFFREALITARLEHPGIVPVHEAGRWPDGTPFYAMKLVAGRPLKALIDECKSLEDRLALLPHVIAVADAIAYAHDRKIIHRDLKPSNIIVGDFGETVVIDWGLAKDISDQAPADDPVEDGPYRTAAPTTDGVTVAGSIVGTPAYMSPEQARGEPVDERTDVYAIGRILDTLLTEEGSTRRRANLMSRELWAVADKATKAHAEHRYASATCLAGDLRRVQLRAPVSARQYRVLDRAGLLIARHRALASTIALATVVGLVLSALAITKLAHQRERALNAETVARSAERDAVQTKDDLLLQHAETLLAKDPTEAHRLLGKYTGTDRVRADLIRAQARAYGTAAHEERAHFDAIRLIAVVPGGRVLTVGQDRRVLEGPLDGKRELVTMLPQTKSAIAISPNGDLFAHHTTSGIRVHDVLRGRSSESVLGSAPVQLQWCSSHRLAAVLRDGTIHLYSFDSTLHAEQTWNLTPPPTYILCNAALGVVAVWHGLNKIALLDESSRDGFTVIGEEVPIAAVSVSPEQIAIATAKMIEVLGSRDSGWNATSPCDTGIADIAIADETHTAVICNEGTVYWLARSEPPRRLFRATGRPRVLHADSFGRYVFVAADDTIYFDLAQGSLKTLRGHRAPVTALEETHSASSRVFTGDASGVVREWNLDLPTLTSFELPGIAVNVRFLDARRVVTDSRVGISWLGSAAGPEKQFKTHDAVSFGVYPAPDGRRFATVGDQGTVVVQDVDDARRNEFRHQHGLVRLGFLADGSLASGGEEGTILLHASDPGDDSTPILLGREQSAIQFLITIPPIDHIITFSSNRILTVMSRQGTILLRRSFPNDATAFTKSPDGSHVAFGDDMGRVHLMETTSLRFTSTFETGRAIRYMNVSNGGLLSVVTEDGNSHLFSSRRPPPWTRLSMDATWTTISPDGNILGFASRTGQICGYGLNQGRWQCVDLGQGYPNSIAFSPDSPTVAAVTSDGRIHFQPLEKLATPKDIQ